MDKTAIAAIVIGLGATVAAMVFPARHPNAPKWAVELSWWGGISLVLGGTLYLLYDFGVEQLSKLQPSHLIVTGSIGAALFLVVALGRLAWRWAETRPDRQKPAIDYGTAQPIDLTGELPKAPSLSEGEKARLKVRVEIPDIKQLGGSTVGVNFYFINDGKRDVTIQEVALVQRMV